MTAQIITPAVQMAIHDLHLIASGVRPSVPVTVRACDVLAVINALRQYSIECDIVEARRAVAASPTPIDDIDPEDSHVALRRLFHQRS